MNAMATGSFSESSHNIRDETIEMANKIAADVCVQHAFICIQNGRNQDAYRYFQKAAKLSENVKEKRRQDGQKQSMAKDRQDSSQCYRKQPGYSDESIQKSKVERSGESPDASGPNASDDKENVPPNKKGPIGSPTFTHSTGKCPSNGDKFWESSDSESDDEDDNKFNQFLAEEIANDNSNWLSYYHLLSDITFDDTDISNTDQSKPHDNYHSNRKLHSNVDQGLGRKQDAWSSKNAKVSGENRSPGQGDRESFMHKKMANGTNGYTRTLNGFSSLRNRNMRSPSARAAGEPANNNLGPVSPDEEKPRLFSNYSVNESGSSRYSSCLSDVSDSRNIDNRCKKSSTGKNDSAFGTASERSGIEEKDRPPYNADEEALGTNSDTFQKGNVDRRYSERTSDTSKASQSLKAEAGNVRSYKEAEFGDRERRPYNINGEPFGSSPPFQQTNLGRHKSEQTSHISQCPQSQSKTATQRETNKHVRNSHLGKSKPSNQKASTANEPNHCFYRNGNDSSTKGFHGANYSKRPNNDFTNSASDSSSKVKYNIGPSECSKGAHPDGNCCVRNKSNSSSSSGYSKSGQARNIKRESFDSNGDSYRSDKNCSEARDDASSYKQHSGTSTKSDNATSTKSDKGTSTKFDKRSKPSRKGRGRTKEDNGFFKQSSHSSAGQNQANTPKHESCGCDRTVHPPGRCLVHANGAEKRKEQETRKKKDSKSKPEEFQRIYDEHDEWKYASTKGRIWIIMRPVVLPCWRVFKLLLSFLILIATVVCVVGFYLLKAVLSLGIWICLKVLLLLVGLCMPVFLRTTEWLRSGNVVLQIKWIWREKVIYFLRKACVIIFGTDFSASQSTKGSTTWKHSSVDLPKTSTEAIQHLLSCKEADPYTTLIASVDASDEEIKRNYRRMAILVHPDKCDKALASDAFKILDQAFRSLTDPFKKREMEEEAKRKEFEERFKNEFEDEYKKFKETMDELLNTIPCDQCENRHKIKKTDRVWYCGRYCGECDKKHLAEDGDLWAESSCLGFVWRCYMCMDSEVYDVTEWGRCQGLKGRFPTNSHLVRLKVSTRSRSSHGGHSCFGHKNSRSRTLSLSRAAGNVYIQLQQYIQLHCCSDDNPPILSWKAAHGGVALLWKIAIDDFIFPLGAMAPAMFFNGNWSRMAPLSGNNEQVILAQICKLKLEVMYVKGHEEK